MSDERNEMTPSEPELEHGEETIEGWETVAVVNSEEEAHFIVDFLRSRELLAEAESLMVSELPVVTGGLGQVRVRVPIDEAASAHAHLASREQVELAEGEIGPAGDGSNDGVAGERATDEHDMSAFGESRFDDEGSGKP